MKQIHQNHGLLENDNYFIYLYQTSRLDIAYNHLFEKYLPFMRKITEVMYYKFSNVPLELEDLEFLIFETFNFAIDYFKDIFGKSFKNFLQTHLKWKIIAYVSLFVSKNHTILNYAKSYNEALEYQEMQLQETVTYDVYNKKTAQLKDILDKINLSKLEKIILELRLNGEDNQQIAVKLNLKYKQIDNALQRIRKKYQNQ